MLFCVFFEEIQEATYFSSPDHSQTYLHNLHTILQVQY